MLLPCHLKTLARTQYWLLVEVIQVQGSVFAIPKRVLLSLCSKLKLWPGIYIYIGTYILICAPAVPSTVAAQPSGQGWLLARRKLHVDSVEVELCNLFYLQNTNKQHRLFVDRRALRLLQQ